MVLLWLSSSGLTKREIPATLSFIFCFLLQLSHHHQGRAQAQQRHRAKHRQLPQADCFLPAKAGTGSHLLTGTGSHLCIAPAPATAPASSTTGAVGTIQASQPCSPNSAGRSHCLSALPTPEKNPTQHTHRVHLLHKELTFSRVFCYL